MKKEKRKGCGTLFFWGTKADVVAPVGVAEVSNISRSSVVSYWVVV